MAEIPETHVLAVASHVAYGYVGNTMATFVMQALGCEVTALNTVNFSNHTAYKQVKGRKTPADEIAELYEGLKQSHLNDFDVMLSGYCPSAEVVQEVGRIARETRLKSTTKPGSFFWVLDPVMGDNGRIYVNEDVVPAYKSLIKDADLILPNQFEAELLSGVKITDFSSLAHAIATLHKIYRVPHIIITSVTLPPTTTNTPQPTRPSSPSLNTPSSSAPTPQPYAKLSIVGSTATTSLTPRLFRLTVPQFPIFFSGTGDMFAALLIPRLRESCAAASLLATLSWRSPDSVAPTDLPLARAAEKVLASMHAVLRKTMDARAAELARIEALASLEPRGSVGVGDEAAQLREKERHLALTKAAEVRVVRNWRDLVEPPEGERFRAMGVEVDAGEGQGALGEVVQRPGRAPDELGVLNVGVGGERGAAYVLEVPQGVAAAAAAAAADAEAKGGEE